MFHHLALTGKTYRSEGRDRQVIRWLQAYEQRRRVSEEGQTTCPGQTEKGSRGWHLQMPGSFTDGQKGRAVRVDEDV